MHTQQMIRTHPHVDAGLEGVLSQCIEACYDCGQACTACADACLGETMVQDLVQCIRLNLDCADICAAAGAVASRRSGSNEPIIRALLASCEQACGACAEECELHADEHAHCRICADACRQCERACRNALGAVH